MPYYTSFISVVVRSNNCFDQMCVRRVSIQLSSDRSGSALKSEPRGKQDNEK